MVTPLTYEHLINQIAERHGEMSKRFQQIARFVAQNPNDVALESVKSISAMAAVQPSTLVASPRPSSSPASARCSGFSRPAC